MLWAVAAWASAQPGPAGAADWALDRDASRITFGATQLGARFTGEFRRFDADIRFDPADPQDGRVVLTIDTASASTGSAERDSRIGTADWLHSGAHPTARVVTTALRPLGADRYEIEAELTLRGVTRPIRFPATITVADGRGRAVGTVTIDRTTFGVGLGPWADGKMVGIPVDISFDLVATTER